MFTGAGAHCNYHMHCYCIRNFAASINAEKGSTMQILSIIDTALKNWQRFNYQNLCMKNIYDHIISKIKTFTEKKV